MALRMQHKQSTIEKFTSHCEYRSIAPLFLYIYPGPYAQVHKKVFKCNFYEVPITSYSSKGFPNQKFEITDPTVNVFVGTLEVNLSEANVHAGTFKMAHPGKINFINGSGPLANGKVCVKQVFDRKPDGSISRLKGRHKLKRLSIECNCLTWASILLDLTYKFVACEIKRMGEPLHPTPAIPTLHFTCSMIALV